MGGGGGEGGKEKGLVFHSIPFSSVWCSPFCLVTFRSALSALFCLVLFHSASVGLIPFCAVLSGLVLSVALLCTATSLASDFNTSGPCEYAHARGRGLPARSGKPVSIGLGSVGHLSAGSYRPRVSEKADLAAKGGQHSREGAAAVATARAPPPPPPLPHPAAAKYAVQ